MLSCCSYRKYNVVINCVKIESSVCVYVKGYAPNITMYGLLHPRLLICGDVILFCMK